MLRQLGGFRLRNGRGINRQDLQTLFRQPDPVSPLSVRDSQNAGSAHEASGLGGEEGVGLHAKQKRVACVSDVPCKWRFLRH